MVLMGEGLLEAADETLKGGIGNSLLDLYSQSAL